MASPTGENVMASGVIVVLAAAVLSLGVYAQMLRRQLVRAQRSLDTRAADKIVWLSRSPIRRQLSNAGRIKL
jgi:hypothetical protein